MSETSGDDKPDLTYGPDQDDGQDYVDRSNLDFDPEDGLYSGTAVEGDTDIPGPHAGETEDVDPSDDESEDDDSGEAAEE